ncbi:MAG: 50S ribosomal protein L1 [Fimbriiglobus sp.]|jgi:large subunit ribosomal protein L1|nr:50S ribosomal protein L1 [Fimbriiglobus sp.]
MANENEAAANQAAPPVVASPAPAEQSAPAPQAGKPEDATPRKKKKPGIAPKRGKKLKSQLRNQEKKFLGLEPTSIKQAVVSLKSARKAKFDETVELHINLGIDASQSDQAVRGTVSLPHGIGKSVRVAVFCQGDKIAQAKAAGADIAGAADLVDKIQKENFLDFDVAITTQDMMPQVAKLGKVLGPRGLMPTPKAGTVIPATADISAVVKEFKAGKVEFRADKTGQVHVGVGKMSFTEDKLAENINTLIEAVRAAKPSGVKGNYINAICLTATMTRGSIPVTI